MRCTNPISFILPWRKIERYGLRDFGAVEADIPQKNVLYFFRAIGKMIMIEYNAVMAEEWPKQTVIPRSYLCLKKIESPDGL